MSIKTLPHLPQISIERLSFFFSLQSLNLHEWSVSESVWKMYTYPDREQKTNIHEVNKRKRFTAWYDENQIELIKSENSIPKNKRGSEFKRKKEKWFTFERRVFNICSMLVTNWESTQDAMQSISQNLRGNIRIKRGKIMIFKCAFYFLIFHVT